MGIKAVEGSEEKCALKVFPDVLIEGLPGNIVRVYFLLSLRAGIKISLSKFNFSMEFQGEEVIFPIINVGYFS